jgi:hypothetical protein
MTATIPCPLCGQPTTAEQRPVEFDDNGLPLAGGVQRGFGVPVLGSGKWQVALNGIKLDDCFAFDRNEGWVWINERDADDKLIIVGEEIQVKKLFGRVTVTPMFL